MNRSAARSSSAVLTPGRIFAASRFIARARICPAAAIRSISWGLFLMITARPSPRRSQELRPRRSHVLLEAQRRDHRTDMVMHLAGAARAVDPAQQPALVVVLDQRLGLLVVDRQPSAHHLGLVVIALDQARAVLVADALALRGIVLHVVVVARLHAHAPAGEPSDHLCIGDIDQERGCDPTAGACELLIECPSLLKRAREAVQDEAVARILLIKPLGR